MIPLDYQCTAWPDTWFGVSVNGCCVAHDLAPAGWSADIELAKCVAHSTSGDPLVALFFTGLGVVMLTGVALFRPLARWWFSRRG